MASKISMNPKKISTLILANYANPKSECPNKGFSKSFTKDYIARSIRETRYFDTIQNITNRSKQGPVMALGSQSYDELFKKLVESCRSYFTKEYGKNEEDYNMFVEKCSQVYATPDRHEDMFVIDRMKLFRLEKEHRKKMDISIVSIKKSKISVLARHKSKGEAMKSRIKQTTAIKRQKSLARKTKKTKRGDVLGVIFERSLSDLMDTSEDLAEHMKDYPKRVKPFVYKLSDPEMIKNGFTVNYQPPVRLVIFSANPISRVSFWFQPRVEVQEHRYPNGRVSWRHDKKGVGTVFYDNGEVAISFIYGKIGPLIVVYSKSEQIRDITIRQVPVALFDTKGNGIVYDKKTGKKRLIYDQAQGILLDTPSNYPIPWKWKSYNQVMCRRAELRFISPTAMDDFDNDRAKVNMKLSENSKRQLKSKRVTSIWESRKSKFNKKKSQRSEYYKSRYHSKIGSSKSGSALTLKRSARFNSILRHIDLPKLLRFVGRGFIIKPVLTPCSEVEPLKVNIISLCLPTHKTPLDSANLSQKPSQDTMIGSSRKGSKSKTKALNRSEDRLFREPSTKCKSKKRHLCLLKPIVINLTDKISLTITEQEHIHIDFISPPQHYNFNIGVRVAVEKVDSVFDVRIPDVNKDYIPSVLEALKMKCPMLYNINNTITNLRKRVLQKSRRDCIKNLKSWGQDKYLGKVPLCKLMNNKCSCRDCNCIPINIETK